MPGRSGERGETLVEVVMAASILAVVLVTAFNIGSLSFRLGAQARERSEAVRIVQEQAERLHLYRDDLVAAHAGEATAIFTTLNFTGCSTVGVSCWFDPANTVSDTSGPTSCSTAGACKQGRYTVTVTIPTLPSSVSIEPTITVKWKSAIGTNDNVSQIKLFLADKRAITPKDCSVAGQPSCQ